MQGFGRSGLVAAVALGTAVLVAVLVWVVAFRGGSSNLSVATPLGVLAGAGHTSADVAAGRADAGALSIPTGATFEIASYSLRNLAPAGSVARSITAPTASAGALSLVPSQGAAAVATSFAFSGPLVAAGSVRRSDLSGAGSAALAVPFSSVASAASAAFGSLAPAGTIRLHVAPPVTSLGQRLPKAPRTLQSARAETFTWWVTFCAKKIAKCPYKPKKTYPRKKSKYVDLWFVNVDPATKAQLVFFDPKTEKVISETPEDTLQSDEGGISWCCLKPVQPGTQLGIAGRFDGVFDEETAYLVTFK